MKARPSFEEFCRVLMHIIFSSFVFFPTQLAFILLTEVVLKDGLSADKTTLCVRDPRKMLWLWLQINKFPTKFTELS